MNLGALSEIINLDPILLPVFCNAQGRIGFLLRPNVD